VKGLVAHRTRSAADLNAYASDVAGREIRLHHLRAYPMVVAATLETLLGLFGTVGGMVGAFEAVALAGKMGDPSIMAEDISYALMTTAVGLVIAVPSLAAYHYFRARTSVLALSLEEELTELIADWFLKEDATRAH
jgi:biopolymer transport protein ExbB